MTQDAINRRMKLERIRIEDELDRESPRKFEKVRDIRGGKLRTSEIAYRSKAERELLEKASAAVRKAERTNRIQRVLISRTGNQGG